MSLTTKALNYLPGSTNQRVLQVVVSNSVSPAHVDSWEGFHDPSHELQDNDSTNTFKTLKEGDTQICAMAVGSDCYSCNNHLLVVHSSTDNDNIVLKTKLSSSLASGSTESIPLTVDFDAKKSISTKNLIDQVNLNPNYQPSSIQKRAHTWLKECELLHTLWTEGLVNSRERFMDEKEYEEHRAPRSIQDIRRHKQDPQHEIKNSVDEVKNGIHDTSKVNLNSKYNHDIVKEMVLREKSLVKDGVAYVVVLWTAVWKGVLRHGYSLIPQVNLQADFINSSLNSNRDNMVHSNSTTVTPLVTTSRPPQPQVITKGNNRSSIPVGVVVPHQAQSSFTSPVSLSPILGVATPSTSASSATLTSNNTTLVTPVTATANAVDTNVPIQVQGYKIDTTSSSLLSQAMPSMSVCCLHDIGTSALPLVNQLVLSLGHLKRTTIEADTCSVQVTLTMRNSGTLPMSVTVQALNERPPRILAKHLSNSNQTESGDAQIVLRRLEETSECLMGQRLSIVAAPKMYNGGSKIPLHVKGRLATTSDNKNTESSNNAHSSAVLSSEASPSFTDTPHSVEYESSLSPEGYFQFLHGRFVSHRQGRVSWMGKTLYREINLATNETQKLIFTANIKSFGLVDLNRFQVTVNHSSSNNKCVGSTSFSSAFVKEMSGSSFCFVSKQ